MASVVVATDEGIRSIGASGPPHLEGQDVTALAASDRGWRAVVGGSRLLTADGDAWRSPFDLPGAGATCAVASGDVVWVGTEEAHLLVVDTSGPAEVATFDEVAERDDWYTPWGGPPAVRSLAVAPDGTLFVNVHVGGIVRSPDDGATWRPTIDIDTDVHQVVVDATSGAVLAALGMAGVAVSRDSGDTWDISDDGMHASYCRAVAIAGETVVASAADGPFGRRGAVYRRHLDDGGPWERCTAGLPEWFDGNIDTFWLSAFGEDVAFTSPDGRLWVSQNAGASWEQAAEGLDTVSAVVVTA